MVKAVPIENSRQIGVIVSAVIGIVLATVFVILRLVAKRMSSGFDYSDYCVLAALVRHFAMACNSVAYKCLDL